MLKLGVFVSGSGSNFQSILDAIDSKILGCTVEVVISDNPKAKALKRAEEKGIRTFIIDKKNLKGSFGDKALELIGDKLDLLVLAGFLSILKGDILKVYKNKIINIHPSLIPKYCGKGMYGLKVHEAVLKNNEKLTGCTVHFVNEIVDGGDIICQSKVKTDGISSPEELQKRVLIEEHKLLVKVIRLIEENRLCLTPWGIKILEEVKSNETSTY